MPRINRPISRQRRQTLKLIAFGLLATLAICSVIVYRNAFAASFMLATTMQPERYSALYFDNSAKLPQYAPAGKTEQLVFHITNHEGTETSYTYIARIQTGSTSVVLDTQSMLLADGSTSTNTVRFNIPKANTAAVITITLAGRTEHLLFRTRS